MKDQSTFSPFTTLEVVPKTISNDVTALCASICPGISPLFIPVQRCKWSQRLECFKNVRQMILRNHGVKVLGWAIWLWENVMIEAEAHCVWQSPEGKLVDVTPHESEDTSILFLPDKSMIDNGRKIPNKRMPLSLSSLVAEFIKCSEEIDSILCHYLPGEQMSSDDKFHFQILSIKKGKIQLDIMAMQKRYQVI